ncbi:hypothetical protein BDQ17DRAFT_1327294 [Cyathus striatus]|nr:hypothetical protein BDQ17DRAFT_1327294 [Cyathus striatus]
MDEDITHIASVAYEEALSLWELLGYFPSHDSTGPIHSEPSVKNESDDEESIVEELSNFPWMILLVLKLFSGTMDISCLVTIQHGTQSGESAKAVRRHESQIEDTAFLDMPHDDATKNNYESIAQRIWQVFNTSVKEKEDNTTHINMKGKEIALAPLHNQSFGVVIVKGQLLLGKVITMYEKGAGKGGKHN